MYNFGFSVCSHVYLLNWLKSGDKIQTPSTITIIPKKKKKKFIASAIASAIMGRNGRVVFFFGGGGGGGGVSPNGV